MSSELPLRRGPRSSLALGRLSTDQRLGLIILCRAFSSDHPRSASLGQSAFEPATRGDDVTRELVSDLQLCVEKPGVCVALTGHAVGSGRPRAALRVRAGTADKAIEVIGDREAEWGPSGVRFSPPKPIDELPISYRRAYGGVDYRVPPVTEVTPESVAELVLRLRLGFHPGAYPRNPVGTGFVVVDGPRQPVALPNFEDPRDLLTPERLVVGDVRRWWTMPRPASTLPIMPGWFPRCVHFGTVPEHAPPDDLQLAEVRAGGLEPGFVARTRARPLEEKVTLRAFAGASDGLAALDLAGGDRVEVTGTRTNVRFELPHREAWPKLAATALGRGLEAPALRPLYVDIDGDSGCVSITYGGVLELSDPYLAPRRYERLTDFDPFADVRLSIDGERVDPPRPSWKEAS